MRRSGWLLLDNDGSYNGYFDWCPRHLRVGPWSPLAPTFLCAAVLTACAFKPVSLGSDGPAAPALGSTWWWIHGCVGLWGVAINVHMVQRYTAAPVFATYTGWAWHLLTLRALLSCTASALRATLGPDSVASYATGYVAEVLRFPALVNASTTFAVWNAVLLPLFAFMHSDREKRSQFLAWNNSFGMVNVHILNLPLALAVTALGGIEAGVRPLLHIDLWYAYAVSLVYGLFYLLVLDRLGVHLYPILSPRSHACVVVYGLILALMYGCWRGWNASLCEHAAVR